MSENQRKRTKLNDTEKKALREMFGDEEQKTVEAAEGEEAVEQTETLGFGAQLKQAREAKGFAVGDMVGRLRASVKQVRALENETMEDLPEPVYIRGFLRSYARILELNGDELVKDFNARYAPNQEEMMMHQIPSIAYQSEQVLHDRSPSQWWKIGGAILVVVAILAGGWSLYMQNKSSVSLEEKTVATKQATVAAAARPTVPAAPVMPQVPDVQLSADNGSAISISAGKSEVRLRLSTKSSCWVRVSRLTDDSTVFEQEIPPGTVRIVRGPKPLRLIIGNPDGTSLQINDTEVDMRQFVSPRDGTVRFRLH